MIFWNKPKAVNKISGIDDFKSYVNDNSICKCKTSFFIGNAGLTLVEVIVSITILACISIPLMAYFSDSLKYSAVTAKQQKATILAQSMTEDIKNQQTLLSVVSSNNNLYTVPYMEKVGFLNVKGVSGNGTFDSKDCFKLDSVSKLPISVVSYNAVFYEDGTPVGATPVSGNMRKYDVDVVLSTESKLNSGEHPILYGLNDVTDIVSIEGNQIQDAILYFKGINAAYGGPVRLTDAQIRSKMVRTIVVDYDFIGSAENDPDAYYQVKVYYLFKCQGLKSTDPDGWEETTSSPLNYTKIKSPKNLYIMFNRLHPTAVGDDWDRIMVSVSDNVKNILGGDFKLPSLYLIVQNLSTDTSLFTINDGTANSCDYSIQIGVDTDVTNVDLSSLSVHSNLLSVGSDSSRTFTYARFVRSNKFELDPIKEKLDSTNLDTPPFLNSQFWEITSRGPLLRVVNIETHVYDLNSDGVTRGAELATYSTSKGE